MSERELVAAYGMHYQEFIQRQGESALVDRSVADAQPEAGVPCENQTASVRDAAGGVSAS